MARPATKSDQASFVDRFVDIAIEISKSTGVKPEVVLGQTALETGWGLSKASGNNMFGIKGKGQVLSTHEDYGKGLQKEKASFRTYKDPVESFKDYGNFTIKGRQLSEIVKPDMTPAQQIAAIKSAGYATDKKYTGKMNDILANVRATPAFQEAAITAVAALDPAKPDLTGTPSALKGSGEKAQYGEEQAFTAGTVTADKAPETGDYGDVGNKSFSDIVGAPSQDQPSPDFSSITAGLAGVDPLAGISANEPASVNLSDVDVGSYADITAGTFDAQPSVGVGESGQYGEEQASGAYNPQFDGVPAGQEIPGNQAAIVDATGFNTPYDQQTPSPMDQSTFDAIVGPQAKAQGEVSLDYAGTAPSGITPTDMGKAVGIEATPRAESGFHNGTDGWEPAAPMGPHAAEFDMTAAENAANTRDSIASTQHQLDVTNEMLGQQTAAKSTFDTLGPIANGTSLGGIAAGTLDLSPSWSSIVDEQPAAVVEDQPAVAPAPAAKASPVAAAVQQAAPAAPAPGRSNITVATPAPAVAPPSLAPAAAPAPPESTAANPYGGYTRAADAFMDIGAGLAPMPTGIPEGWGKTAFSDSVYSTVAANDIYDALATQGALPARTDLVDGFLGEVNSITQRGNFDDAMVNPQAAADYNPGLLNGQTGDAIKGAVSGLITGGPVGAVVGGVAGYTGATRAVDGFLESLVKGDDSGSSSYGGYNLGDVTMSQQDYDRVGAAIDSFTSNYGGGGGSSGGGMNPGGGYGNADGSVSNNGPGIW
jgi:hypothetical protein